MEVVTLVLSILGALSWIPILIVPLFDHFRKINIVPLDVRIFTNATTISADKQNKKSGTILLLVLNIFICKTTIFARKIVATVKLKNGTVLKTELLSCSTLTSNNIDGTKSEFEIPEEREFSISRTM